MNIIEALEKEQLRSDIPEFRPGDTVRVHAKIVEGTRERIQVFEGVVIGRQGSGVREMFRVILRESIRLRSCGGALSVVPSSIICAGSRARRLVSRKDADGMGTGKDRSPFCCIGGTI